jgi:hypothetical protein
MSNSQGNRHCEPTGRADARPMTGFAKQSIELQNKQEWIASSLSLLAMTSEYSFAISPQVRASFAKSVPPSENQRAQGMPGAQRARSLACKSKKHTS